MTIQIVNEIWKSKIIEKSGFGRDGKEYYFKWVDYKKANKLIGRVCFRKDGSFIAETATGLGCEFNTAEGCIEWLKMLNQYPPVTISGVKYIKNIVIK